MVEKKKRVTRKQLLKEPDKVFTLTGQAFTLIQTHRRRLTVAVGIVVAALLVAVGIHLSLARSEQRAFAELDRATETYLIALKKGDAASALEASREPFSHLIDGSATSRAARLATLMFANICFAGGDVQHAASYYESLIGAFDDSSDLQGLAVMGLARCYASLQESDKALDRFTQVTEGVGYLGKDEALYQIGNLYALKGETQKSQKAFSTLLEQYPDSLYFQIASDKVSL